MIEIAFGVVFAIVIVACVVECLTRDHDEDRPAVLESRQSRRGERRP